MTPRNLVYDKGVEPVPGYRLTDYLGGGTFGEVWKTIDLSTSKHFALKIIDLSYSSSALKELRALKLVMNLNHPNLVPITKAWLKDKHGQSLDLHSVDLVKQKGKLKLLLILMGLGEKSLSARLKEVNRASGGADPEDDEPLARGIPPDELTNYMRGAAKGIDYLNAVRHEGIDAASDGPIVHCDIKPDNMMIVAGTEVQIADCGVAVSLNQDTRKTVSAAFSPVYAPPELATNKPSTGTDQYSLAISYYELRTGLRPFAEGMNQLEMMTAHSLGDLDLSSPTLTAGERRVLKWATSPRIADRYPSCFDMVKQLERGIEGLPPRAPGELQKSVATIHVPPPAPAGGSAPRIVMSGGSNLDMTSAHHVDLFTPPPVSAKGSEPYLSGLPATGSKPDVAPPAAKAPPGNRPGILADRDDPTGGELPEPELDEELQKIIRESQVVTTPSRRRLPDEPDPAPTRQKPSAPSVALKTTGLVETSIRSDTDAPPTEGLYETVIRLEADDDAPSLRRPAPRRRNPQYDGTVVPGREGRDAPDGDAPRQADTRAKKSPGWNDGQGGGKKSSAPMIGVAIGAVILVVGGVAAYLMLPPKEPITVATSGEVPPVTTDKNPGGGTTPTKGDGGGVPTPPTGKTPPTNRGSATTNPGVPMPTEQEIFDQQLKELSPPFATNSNLGKLLASTDKNAPQRAELMKKLLGDAQDMPRLADLADAATAFDRWADFEDRRVELAKAWYAERVQTAYDEASTAVQGTPTPDAAKQKLTRLRKALELPTAKPVMKLLPPAEVQPADRLNAVAVAWSKGGEALPAFGEMLLQEEPPGGKFFAAEYFKLATEANVPIAELKTFRNKTNTWSGIDGSYQVALADHVVKALSVEKPDYVAITKVAGSDKANGWTALADADEKLMNSGVRNVTLPKLPAGMDETGILFVKYLEGCAKPNIDALVELYKAAELPALLTMKLRKKHAASTILKNTPLLKVHRDWSKQPVELFFANPYSGEQQLSVTETRLDTCARLMGTLSSVERMHRYLISVARGTSDISLTEGLRVDVEAIDDEHVAATLAYYDQIASDNSRPPKDRLWAAARAGRLAFKRVDLSFFDCDTDSQVYDREIKLAQIIRAKVTAYLAIDITTSQPADLASLNYIQLRAEITSSEDALPDRLSRLQLLLPKLINTPDYADCLAQCAFCKLLDVYRKAPDAEKSAVWDEVKKEAKESLKLRPDGYLASFVMCLIYSGEYKGKHYVITNIPGPVDREISSDADINKAIEHFDATLLVLGTRKSSALEYMRANFLCNRAKDLGANNEAATSMFKKGENIRATADKYKGKKTEK